MIISHKYKFIFIKPEKTAGSSLEIALSKYCDHNDIITTIGEEYIRKKIPNLVTLTVPKTHVLLNPNNNLLPLSGISKRTTLVCNENGYYSKFESDRFGFNNPDFEWDAEKIDFFLLGDL